MTRFIVKDNNYAVAARCRTVKACEAYIAEVAESDPAWAATFTIWQRLDGEYFKVHRKGMQ